MLRVIGVIAGYNLVGDKRAYKRGTFYNSAKFFDIEYTTTGLVNFNVEGEQTWYQQEPGTPYTTRIVYLPDSTVIGFNGSGRRWDHRVWMQWIEDAAPCRRCWMIFERLCSTKLFHANVYSGRQSIVASGVFMQAGLLTTFKNSYQTRGGVAVALSVLLFGFYVVLYWTSLLDPIAEALHLGSNGILSGTLYTLAIVLGVVYFLRRHGNSRYRRIRTLSVIIFQVVFAYSIPWIMELLNMRGFTFSIFWPLKIDYFYPSALRSRYPLTVNPVYVPIVPDFGPDPLFHGRQTMVLQLGVRLRQPRPKLPENRFGICPTNPRAPGDSRRYPFMRSCCSLS